MGEALPVPSAVLTEAVATRLPGVAHRPMFGCPGWFVGGKAFAVVMGDGLCVKLGRARASSLVDAGDAFPMVVMGRTMGGWITVAADDLDEDWPLVLEAKAFVEEG